MLSLLSAGLFEREPQGIPLSEQKLWLRSDLKTASEMLQLLGAAAQQKLLAVLQEGKDDVFRLIVSDVA